MVLLGLCQYDFFVSIFLDIKISKLRHTDHALAGQEASPAGAPPPAATWRCWS
jgi:hypothetical protein